MQATRGIFTLLTILALFLAVNSKNSYAQIPCVSGFVYDPSGNPVVDADLDFDDVVTGERIYTPGDNTDEFGFYRVCVLPGTYHISYAPPPKTHLMGKRLLNVSLSLNQFLEKNVTLDNGLVINGTIADESGAGIAGVDIDADIISTGERIYTPGDNTDSLTGQYWIVVPPEYYRLRYQPPPGTRYRGVQLDSVAVFSDATVDVTIYEGMVLSGHITGNQGEGLPNISIDLRDQTTGNKVYLPFNETDSTGYYRVVADTGLFVLRFAPPYGSRLVAVAVDSFYLQDDIEYDRTLQEGRMVTFDIRDSLGNPVEGADIDLIQVNSNAKIFTPYDKTDSTGVTVTSVLQDIYTIRVDPPPGTFFDRLVVDSVTIGNDTTLTLTLPEVEKVMFSGQVVDYQSVGIENVEIDFTDTLSGKKIYAVNNVTDFDGYFNIAVPASVFDIEFKPPIDSRYVALVFHNFTISQDTVLETITLDTGLFFYGQVYDKDGYPVENVDFDFTSETSGQSVATPNDNTDMSGLAKMTVPADVYSIILTPPMESSFKGLSLTGIEIVSDTSAMFFLENKTDLHSPVFLLKNNYPNPFNNNTEISYILFEGNQVELNIYNVLGQRLLTIDRGYQPPGFYAIDWNGRDQGGHIVAGGVYFYQLKTPNGKSTRKMLLLR